VAFIWKRWHVPALLALGLAALASVPQVVLLGKLPDNNDYWLQEYVHLAFLHRWLHLGEVPLWNSQLAAGTPHLADPQAAVLYPLTTLPLLLLPPEAVARLSIPLHFFLAGALTYGYTRALGLSRTASMASGLAYMLAPHFAPLTTVTHLQQSAAWVPGIAWALHAGFARRQVSPFAVAGLLWALQLSRGYPQTWYVTGLFAAGYVAVRGLGLLMSTPRRRPREAPPSIGPVETARGDQAAITGGGHRQTVSLIAGGAALFAVSGLAAGAAQLLPSLELLRISHRSAAVSLAQASTLGAVDLHNLLGAAGPSAEVQSAFPGGVVVALALAALLYARGPQVWLHAGIAAAGLALSLGSRAPLWALAYSVVPGFSVLHMPHRMLFIWSFGLAVLAGLGVDALRRCVQGDASHRPLFVSAVAVAGVLWLAQPALVEAPLEAARGVRQLALGVLVVPALTLAALLAQARLRGGLSASMRPGKSESPMRTHWMGRIAPLAPATMAALVAVDLLGHSLPRMHGKFYPPSAVYEPPAVVRWLRDRSAEHVQRGEGPYRIAGAQYGAGTGPTQGVMPQDNRRLHHLPPNTPGLYGGLDAAYGYLAIRLSAAGHLFGAVNDLGSAPRELSIYDPRSRLVDLLNVRYFITDDVETFPSIVGGGQSLGAGQTGTAIVREAGRALALEIDSSLGDSVEVADGMPVAEAIVHTVDGAELRFTLRAGEHTAEWLYDAPHVSSVVRHRRAPVARRNARDGSLVFRARFDLASLGDTAVREIELRTLHPRVRWNVDRLTLHTRLTDRFRPAFSDGSVRIWENPHVLPRAWWVGAYAVETDRSVALERLRDATLDLKRQAVLPAAIAELRPSTPGAPDIPSTGGSVRWLATTANRRQMDVSAPAAGLLLISEMAAPGWQARVDGRPVPVYPANGGLQAVPVPAGTHRLELQYLPTSVVAGSAISVATLLLAALWAVWATRGSWIFLRRRRLPPVVGRGRPVPRTTPAGLA
jgi:hypothetical protein